MDRWVVSACLLGQVCRYDARSKGHDGVQARVEAHRAAGGEVVAVCPEQLGGLSTPRPAADLRGGGGQAVLDGRASVCRVHDDKDVSDAFVEGAKRAASASEGATFAVLKARSPSCGVGQTYVGGELADYDGVFAALLRRRGVTLATEASVLSAGFQQQGVAAGEVADDHDR